MEFDGKNYPKVYLRELLAAKYMRAQSAKAFKSVYLGLFT